MTRQLLLILSTLSAVILFSGCTSNTGIKHYNINQALNAMPSKVKNKTGEFKFYFGDDSIPFLAEKLGEIQTTNRTNAFAKEPLISCNWVFYSALLDLKAQSLKLGGNGVANINSNWKNNIYSSSTEYVCDNGLWMSGVALLGTAIKQ